MTGSSIRKAVERVREPSRDECTRLLVKTWRIRFNGDPTPA